MTADRGRHRHSLAPCGAFRGTCFRHPPQTLSKEQSAVRHQRRWLGAGDAHHHCVQEITCLVRCSLNGNDLVPSVRNSPAGSVQMSLFSLHILFAPTLVPPSRLHGVAFLTEGTLPAVGTASTIDKSPNIISRIIMSCRGIILSTRLVMLMMSSCDCASVHYRKINQVFEKKSTEIFSFHFLFV